MRWPAAVFLALCAVPAVGVEPGDAISAVLDRSQLIRLAAMPSADAESADARSLRADFEILVRALDLPRAIELRVIQGEVIGETLQGRVVAVNESLARLPQGDRLFVLAHEIGHVALEHWTEMGGLYRKWSPGEVVKSQTDAVAGELGRDASALAYRQEFEADAFALRTMRALGRSDDDVISTFVHLGMRNDTATHPGSRRRIAALRALMGHDARIAQSRPFVH